MTPHFQYITTIVILLLSATGIVLGADKPSSKAKKAAGGQAKLLHQADLKYRGAFKFPDDRYGESDFHYGGTAITYSPKQDSLFIVGHDHQQAVAEVKIPEIREGGLSAIATAEVLQPFVRVSTRIPNYTLEDNVKIGGLLVVEDKLVGALYEYYDGDGDAQESHFTLDSLDLKDAKVGGLYKVGPQGGGFVGGYMATVPEPWQKQIGASHLTGQAALAVISRTSSGPCLFGFNPSSLGKGVSPVQPLVCYPLKYPLAKGDEKNPLYNLCTEIRGVFFAEGTNSVLFFGSHGLGDYNYGPGEDFGDKARLSKGPHMAPYTYQVWAYDAAEFLAVKAGRKMPWQVRPYDVWKFDLPYPEDAKHIGGLAYDRERGRIFVSQQLADGDKPVIHVFDLPSK